MTFQTWWEWAGQDAVLFHATLHLAAFDLSELAGEHSQIMSKQLLNRDCIRLLRERIEDPILGIGDQTMGSILFLIIVDVRPLLLTASHHRLLIYCVTQHERGNMKMVRMHVQGIKRMVELRGGLEQISASNPTLANLIFGQEFLDTYPYIC